MCEAAQTNVGVSNNKTWTIRRSYIDGKQIAVSSTECSEIWLTLRSDLADRPFWPGWRTVLTWLARPSDLDYSAFLYQYVPESTAGYYMSYFCGMCRITFHSRGHLHRQTDRQTDTLCKWYWKFRHPGCSNLILLASCQQTCMTYTIAVCTVKNSWWWTEELSETCRVSFQK
jgi:hypothetical protein